MNNQDFGKFISELRKEKGLTQKELGKKLNLTDKAISRWENGKSYPDIEMLESISKELDVSISELIACRKIETQKEAELETVKLAINEANKASKSKKIAIAMLIIFAIIALLLVTPTSFRSYDDGGTTEYQALSYKIVKWNKMIADNEIYSNTSVYFLGDSQRMIDDLWHSEKFSITHNDTNISEIEVGAVNIGAVMPSISYMDDEFIVFGGSCGVVVYDYKEKKVNNIIDAELLSSLGYEFWEITADGNSRTIQIALSPVCEYRIPPLEYNIDSKILKRLDYGNEIQASSNIDEIDYDILSDYEFNKKLLMSNTCYKYNGKTAYLTAKNNWDMATLKLIVDKDGQKTEYKIFQ